MEVYHRLRIFENIADDGMFPFISASLNITPPATGTTLGLRFANGDSAYNSSTTKFTTEWLEMHAKDRSDNLRLYLYGDISGEYISSARTPKTCVWVKPSDYPTTAKPLSVSDDYYLKFAGVVPEYTTDAVPAGVIPSDSGFIRSDSMNVDRRLAADLFTFIQGPFIRSTRAVKEVNVSGTLLNRPDLELYHIGESHWIDVSKLTACDPAAFVDSTLSKSIGFYNYPEEWIYASDFPSTASSYNEYMTEDNWKDCRFNALALSEDDDSIVFRPKVSTAPCADGYRVYLSCILSNIPNSATADINHEWYKMFSGVLWDWINVQIWEGNTYLSSDVFVSFDRTSGQIEITYNNTTYNNNGTPASDEDALQKAQDTIKAIWGHGSRIDIFAIVNNDNAMICTTELASSISYDVTWHYSYDESFVTGSHREGDVDFQDTPVNAAMQYKVYASTETPLKDSAGYTMDGKVVKDEYHFMTSIPVTAALFGKTVQYYAGDTDPMTVLLPNEMHTGLKWDNVEYDPRT